MKKTERRGFEQQTLGFRSFGADCVLVLCWAGRLRSEGPGPQPGASSLSGYKLDVGEHGKIRVVLVQACRLQLGVGCWKVRWERGE